MPRALVISASFVLALGCDPFASLAEDEPAHDTDRSSLPVPPEPSERTRELAADDGDCLAACAAGAALSPTDRETCRLVCSTEARADVVPADSALARLEVCREHCTDARATDRESCKLDCAASVPATIDDLSLDARRCFRPCLEQASTCDVGCEGDDDTNATCGLQCEALARRCLASCPGAES